MKRGGPEPPLRTMDDLILTILFYFNLNEAVSHLEQERNLHAINCVVVFANVFISNSNNEQ